MHPTGLLAEVVGVFGLAVAVVLVCHRVKLPTVVGLLLTGVITGPHGLALVRNPHDVEALAEIGVVSLLFTIGLEFSVGRLLELRNAFLVAGPLQVALAVAAGLLAALGLGQPFPRALFLGLLISLSSTAVVLSLLEEQGEVDTPNGRVGLGILIAQDVAIVPFMLLTPLLGGESPSLAQVARQVVLPVVAFGLGLPILTRWVVPSLLALVTRSRDRQLFLLTTVFLALGVAWVSSVLGLSLALGAFLAGLTIAGSEFSHRALGNVLPLRDLLTSFFFISIGMLLNLDFVLAHPWLVLLAAVALVVAKGTSGAVATLVIGYPLRVAVLVGLALAQMGEFTFILYQAGARHGLLAGELQNVVLAVAVLTMMATPLLLRVAPRVADAVTSLPLPARLIGGREALQEAAEAQAGHLVIIGYGLNGRNLVRAATTLGIPYTVLEMNLDTVRRERGQGVHIHYGDASQEAVLEHLGVARARVVVVAISDPAATRRVVEVARRLSPDTHLIARTRYASEVPALMRLGANEVIPEEFETSVEIFVRVLHQWLVPQEQIDAFVTRAREDGYALLRRVDTAQPLEPVMRQLPGVDLAAVTVAVGSGLADRSLAELSLRQACGVTLLAVQRGSETLANPDGSAVLQAGDRLIMIGTPEQVGRVRNLAHPA